MRASWRAATVVAVAAGLAACGPPTPEEIGAGADTVADETLTACVTPTPRLVVVVDGGYEGYDVEALEAVADALGLTLAVEEVAFDDIVSGVAVNEGRCDVGAAGVVADPSLDAIVEVTVPYRDVDRLVVAPAATEGAEVSDLTVGVEDAGPAVDALDQLEAAEVVTAPSLPDLLREAAAGSIDAVLVPATQVPDVTDALGEVRVVARVPTGDSTVMILPVGVDEAVAGVVDDALQTFVDGPAGEQAARRWLDG